MRLDNLREYKREMGITARHRRVTKIRLDEIQRQICAKPGCGLTRYAHERQYGLVPDHKFVEA